MYTEYYSLAIVDITTIFTIDRARLHIDYCIGWDIVSPLAINSYWASAIAE
jgi:hypothetical protein